MYGTRWSFPSTWPFLREQNFRIYWDGDIYEEIFNGIGNYHNQPYLVKYNQGRMGIDGKNLYEYGYSVTCNGTKNSPWQFLLKATSPANGIATTDTISVEVGEITGIEEIENGRLKIENSIYDMLGRKIVNGKSSNSKFPSGLYIKNGKKYVIK